MCDLPIYRKYFRLRGKPPSLEIDDTFYINWFGQSKSANVIEFEGLKRGNLLKWYPSENKASIRDLDNREILRTTSGLFGKRSWTEVNGTTQPRNDQDMIFTQATKIKHSHYTSFYIKECPCFALKQELFFSFQCDPKTQFTCNDGQCIPISGRCNRNTDCADESDEYLCVLAPVDTNTYKQNRPPRHIEHGRLPVRVYQLHSLRLLGLTKLT